MTRIPNKERTGFSRRRFVKTAGAGMLTIGLLACSDDDDDDNPTTPPPEPEPQAVTPSPANFPQSVATGDPKPDSVIFWTRAIDPNAPGTDQSVTLLIGLDEGLTNVIAQINVTAEAQYDNVAKIKVGQLDPYTTYYYQFQMGSFGSVVGRTKTAPTPDADVSVKFAFVSCQDYTKRFYNTHALLSSMPDLDFVVHLGDYIYETSDGAGEIRKNASDRIVNFTNADEALPFGDGTFAANSVSNYRDLYKIYRSDAALQRVHERYPMISTWDDHEFSNDSWQENGTYFGDRVSEASVDRKKNAERVYAEYMPIDFGLDADGNLVNSEEGLYPNTRLYRDFSFGANLHLIMTDYRTFRPDHLIPEDAWPGTVVGDEATVSAILAAQGVPFEAVKSSFANYINIDAPELALDKQILTGVMIQQYLAEGLTEQEAAPRALANIQGNIATFVANLMIEAYNAQVPPQAQRQPLTGDSFGLAYYLMGKQDLFAAGGLGSRNFVVKSTFDLLSAIKYQASGGQSENAWGAEQEAWLQQKITTSTANWRVVGNSCSFTAMLLDLSDIPGLPAEFTQNFYLNVDHWDGFPIKKQETLALLRSRENTLMLAGDVHTSFAAHHGNGLHEFTVTSVSSTTFKGFMRQVGQTEPFAGLPTVGLLIEGLENILLNSSPVINPDSGEQQLKYTRADVNGFATVEINSARALTTYYHIDENEVDNNRYDAANLASYFTTKSFEVRNGVMTEVF